MARKKTAAPQHVEPEEQSQEIPDQEPDVEEEAADEPDSAGKPMSKADACRALIAEGITENEDAVAAARSRFGIDIKPTDFSLYKSKEKKKRGEAAPKARPGRKPRAAVEGYLAPPPKPRASEGEGNLLAAMEAMKPLVDSLGKEQVKRIVDLLG